MNLRTFYRQYGLELIPVALESLTFGKCVWDGGWFDTPSFTRDGMPNYIYNAFAAQGIITLEESDAILDRFRKLPQEPASFANINIELALEDALEIKLQHHLNMNVNFDMKRIASFTISNSKGKEMPNRDLIMLDDMLDQIKEHHWDEYKRGLRRAFIITELYYGTLSLKIDTDVVTDFEASLPASHLQAANKLQLGRTLTYAFENATVPFAMRLKRVKHFNQ